MSTLTKAQERSIRAKFSVVHIFAEGARYHVFSHALYEPGAGRDLLSVSWCSEPFCECNRPAILAVAGADLDPVRCCPLPAAKEWLSGALSLVQGGEG